MRRFLFFILFVNFSVFAQNEVCADKIKSSYPLCLSNKVTALKKEVSRSYSEIIKKISMYKEFKSLKLHVESSYKNWNDQVENDCSIYVFFIEKKSPVNQNEYNLCVINAYSDRINYYKALSNMFDSFI